MGKLDEYSWVKQPQQMIDFKDDVTFLLNNGKFAMPVVTLAPTHAGQPGEMILFYNSTTDGRLYIFTSGAWDQVASFTAST